MTNRMNRFCNQLHSSWKNAGKPPLWIWSSTGRRKTIAARANTDFRQKLTRLATCRCTQATLFVANKNKKHSKAEIPTPSLSSLLPSTCVARYVMGHRSNSPAFLQLMTTEAIPPCELVDGPTMTMHFFTDIRLSQEVLRTLFIYSEPVVSQRSRTRSAVYLQCGRCLRSWFVQVVDPTAFVQTWSGSRSVAFHTGWPRASDAS